MDKWIIMGCGGHARSIADVILYNNPESEIIFVDKNAKDNENILGFPIAKEYGVTNEKVIVGIGDNTKRRELSEKYYNNLQNVISKNAYVSEFAKMGKGIFIAHKAHIGVLSSVDDFVIVNTGALIDHECSIKKAAFIGPNATLCGKVEIEENVFIGAGVTIMPNVKINKNITIGAQSLVTKNILTKEGIYKGIPARSMLLK